MTRAAVALLLCFTLVGCFPYNKRHRSYAKAGEATSILAGIGISAFSKTGADCDAMSMAGIDNSSCRTKAQALGTVGLTLILAGMLGFVATTSTAVDDRENVGRLEIHAEQQPTEKLQLQLPPGVNAPAADDVAAEDADVAGDAGDESTATAGSSQRPQAAPAR
jgi:hypothetical protein